MKKTSRQLLIQIFSIIATLTMASLAKADSKDFKVQVIEHSYTITGTPGQAPQNIKIQVQFAKPKDADQLNRAKAWLSQAEDKYRIDASSRYVVNVGAQNLQVTAPEIIPNGTREELHVPLSRFKQIRNWLAGLTGFVKKDEETQVDVSTPAQRAKYKQALDEFIYKFSNDKLRVPLVAGQSFNLKYLPTLALARATVNGTVISLSFVASGIPFEAAWITGLTLGAISGSIQYKIKPFSDFLEKKGWLHNWYKKALARMMYVSTLGTSYKSGMSWALSKEMAKSTEEDFMKLKFTDSALYNANLISKWWAVEVGILGLADVMFRAFGSPLETSIMGSVSSVLYTSTLATFGQGTWDFAFIVDKAKKEEELKAREESLVQADQLTTEASEEISRGFSKIKFSLAVKAFTISVTSNIAAALLLADSESTQVVANTLMGTLSGAGALYYGFVQFKYNEGLKLKLSKAKEKIAKSCSEFLSQAVPPPVLLPGIHY
jgi:hypothetical protein